jgi:hypothetical protein
LVAEISSGSARERSLPRVQQIVIRNGTKIEGQSHSRYADSNGTITRIVFGLAVFYDLSMAKTIETTISEAEAELVGEPSLVELAARISQREPYSGPPVAPLVRRDRDAR